MNSILGGWTGGWWIGLGSSLLVIGTVLSCGATGYEPANSGEPLPATEAQPSLEDRTPSPEATMDTLNLPPITRTVTAGRYRFTVKADGNWDTDQDSGTLYRDSAVGTQRLWQQNLPHSYGPRYVIVGHQGQVLLLDEFINIASPHAITLLDSQGEVVAQHSFDDIEARLGVHRADLVEQAEQGWWISAPPRVDEARHTVTVATGGKTLIIDLTSGQIGL